VLHLLPQQMQLPFYLWTRAAVAGLIAREYGIEVLLVTAGRHHKARGPESAKAAAARIRKERCGWVEGGLSGGCPAGQKAWMDGWLDVW